MIGGSVRLNPRDVRSDFVAIAAVEGVVGSECQIDRISRGERR